MKVLIGFLIVTMFSAPAFAGFRGFENTTNIGLYSDLKCGVGITCARDVRAMKISATGLKTLVLASATTITAAQCGSTFYNAGAITINLPEASTVLGCKLTFVTLNAAAFAVNPDNADQILVSTNAAGDAISNATLGNSITLQAVSASQWAPLAIQGTYTDAN